MKRTFASILLIVLITFGCASDEKKPSADSLLTTEAFNIIAKIEEAYEGKDKSSLKKYLGTLLAESIIKELSFEKAELSLTPRMVRITGSSVTVNLNWRGSWLITKAKKLENRGVADLVFHRETMKLTYIDGDNPFIIPLVK